MGKYSNRVKTNEAWLPMIPGQWEMKKIKWAFEERSEKGYPDEPLLVASQDMGVVPKNVYGKRTVEALKDLDKLKLVKVGDYVVSLRSFQGGIEYAYYQGIISPAYTIMQPNSDFCSAYYRFLFKSVPFIKLLTTCVTGIREGQNIDYGKLKNHYIPVPSRAEQDQIVRFLDWKVSEINRLIGIKKNQINGYREYEKKVINDKVLYGLQEAPLRESGNHWVGKIPTNWKIIKLGKFCSFQNGISESGNFFTSGTPFVGYSDVYRHLELPKYVKGVAKANEQQQEIFSVRKGDIFFTRTSESIEEIGMAAVCKHTIKDAVFSGFLIRCRPRMPLINEDYMKYYLQIPAVRNHFSSMMNIVIRASLGQNLLKQMPVVVPPLKEQKEIAEFLDAMHERFLRLITTNEEEISMLEELRITLISDVVTGKIDVRNIPVPAYEHVDDMVADGGEGNDEELRIPGEED